MVIKSRVEECGIKSLENKFDPNCKIWLEELMEESGEEEMGAAGSLRVVWGRKGSSSSFCGSYVFFLNRFWAEPRLVDQGLFWV